MLCGTRTRGGACMLEVSCVGVTCARSTSRVVHVAVTGMCVLHVWSVSCVWCVQPAHLRAELCSSPRSVRAQFRVRGLQEPREPGLCDAVGCCALAFHGDSRPHHSKCLAPDSGRGLGFPSVVARPEPEDPRALETPLASRRCSQARVCAAPPAPTAHRRSGCAVARETPPYGAPQAPSVWGAQVRSPSAVL